MSPRLRSTLLAFGFVSGGLGALPSPADAASFTPGNLVIYRAGSGEALVNTGNAVFLDEYTTSGTLVQTIAMPTTASGSQAALYSPGNSSSEGLITRSTNGTHLVITGYASNSAGQLTITTGATVARVVGRIDANGNVDTSTQLTDSVVTGNFRSATSTNGTDIWVTGSSTTGVRYTTFGANGTTTQVTSGSGDWRAVNIFDGQLYLSTTTDANRLNAVGTGLPTSTGNGLTTIVPTPPATSDPWAFFMADLSPAVAGLDTVYFAADNATTSLQKYTKDAGGVWSASGTVPLSSTDGVTTISGIRGLTGSVAENGTVSLFATMGATGGTGAGALYGITDTTGYNGSITGTTPTTLKTLFNAGSFRGVAFVPLVPEPGSLTVLALFGGAVLLRRRK